MRKKQGIALVTALVLMMVLVAVIAILSVDTLSEIRQNKNNLVNSRARNVADAELVLTRHPQAALVLATIEGSVVGDDPAAFWRENAELGLVASQVLPREVFLFYARTAPASAREEAFLVAGQGQMLGAEEATADRYRLGTA